MSSEKTVKVETQKGNENEGKSDYRNDADRLVSVNDDNKSKNNYSFLPSSENEYESEPASLKTFGLRKKKRMLSKDGKTMHPKVTLISAEMRKFAKKQYELEKNLKIEGIPEQPKIRKRRMSLGSNIGRERDSSFKRKRLNSLDARPKKDHMPKWGMLGGDATDPLNLNGLATSEEGRLLNLKTPENSPLPTPDFRKIVYVKVPPNIEDPLNLEGKHDQRVIDMLLNATRKKRHRSKKNKDGPNQSKDANLETSAKLNTPEEKEVKQNDKLVEDSATQKTVNQTTNTNPRARSLSMSPDRKLKRQTSGGKGGKHIANEPKKYPEKPKFTQGNYNRYYGYRNEDCVPDPRLKFFNSQWFHDKDVLDIGCNVGHVTLALAEQFSPRKILGMDIDGKLIGAARQNIRHMLSQRRKDSSKFPAVFEATRGPLEAHPLMGSSSVFPNNVLFLQGNYVPGSEEILNLQREEYDTILALSITKWIHLNNGDHGLKLFFQKIFRQLRPGGKLILEPQPWCTYRKRAKLSPELFKNYSSIKLKPEGFKNYLLSIGFVKCEVVGVPVTKAKGFRRPLILFTKADSQATKTQDQMESSIDFRACTECLGNDRSMCDHIQSTGMRQGAYADRLYDHIAYKSSGPASSELNRTLTFPSPLLHSTDSSASRKDSPFVSGSSLDGVSPFRPYHSGSRYSVSSKDSTRSQTPRSQTLSNNSSNSASRSLSGSERSYSTCSSSSSSSSNSHSSSSYSESSQDTPNGSVNGSLQENTSPGLNGDVAAEIHWVDNENANMEFEDALGGGGDEDVGDNAEEFEDVPGGGEGVDVGENGDGEPVNWQLANGHISGEEG